jgi:hypothetical protein
MDRNDLKTRLDNLSVPADWYRLEKRGIEDQRHNLEHEDGKWQVFYSDRGEKQGLVEHDTEDAACADLLARLMDKLAFKKSRKK